MTVLIGKSKDSNQKKGPQGGVFTDNIHLANTILRIFFYRRVDFRNQLKNQGELSKEGINCYVN